MLFKAWADIRTFLNIDISINFFRPVVTFDNQKTMLNAARTSSQGVSTPYQWPGKVFKTSALFYLPVMVFNFQSTNL